jgi:uncharacterized protein (DUF1697 family)
VIHVVLLRGVNVGGRQMVPMAGLRDLCAGLGFAGARTLLQSGNVVLDAGTKTPAALERALEKEIASEWGISVDVVVRTAKEWNAVVSRNPFGEEAKTDPARLLVMCCKDAIDPKGVKTLEAAIVGRERVRADGRQLYIVYPDGVGRSKLVGTVIEKTLGTRGTARNWNTVLKLHAMIASTHELRR